MFGKLVGEILKRLRKEKGLTQKEIAKSINWSVITIHRLERGKLKEIPLSLILAYLRSLGIPYAKFFSELEDKEIKREVKRLIGKREISRKGVKSAIRYTTGIRFPTKPLINFPEYARRQINDFLSLKGIKETKKYLQFAEEYFRALFTGEPPLEEISERYEKEGLDPLRLWKVKKIVIAAEKRERKRKVKPEPLKKQREMSKRQIRYLEFSERVRERVKRVIFQTKGATATHLKIHLGMIPSAYRLMKEAEGKPSRAAIENWVEKKVKELGERRILEPMLEIVKEEYNRFFPKGC
ncbi:MAG: helix-turn-helix transcriptional regulator [candidate division WOR-3 bacterium]